MHLLTTFFLFASFLDTIAGNAQASSSKTRHRKLARVVKNSNENDLGGNYSKTFSLKDTYHGEGFLTDWDFFTGADPTHGSVKYQNKADAISKRLAFVQSDGTTILTVDDKTSLPIGRKRDSVRISTKKKFNGGLFVADFFAMPHGCSVWPAYWSLGPNWPTGGEIDIVEGVHNQPTNQYTLHTSPGCILSTANSGATSKTLNKQCASNAKNNAGCGFLDTDTRTYGSGFNQIGGGVYAHLWDNSGIRIWHFPRTAIPADITSKEPNPSLWGTPAAFWSASSCDMPSHFHDHSLVLDITICGDFAGPTFSGAGCSGTCAQAVSDPRNFRSAKWALNYIAVYQ